MPRFVCFVVGKGAIALKCSQILLQAEHDILGVCSKDQALKAWAAEHDVFYTASRETFREVLLSSGYEYLFSINNGWIIPPEVIARGKATINYHNSPLPKYAGLHATSWALINGETQHAISWHEVVSEIDAGAIFKQPIIPIQPDDTALSLNTRCFEAAVESFAELVAELADDRAESFAQDLSQRSYFGHNDRPEAAGLLSFDQATQDLYNLVRALDFEPTLNPLGLAKIWLPKGVVGVGQASPIVAPPCPAGQVLALDQQGLQIATRDGAVLFGRVTTLEGISLSAAQLSDRYGVEVGAILPSLGVPMRQTITRQNAACRHERSWVKHLTQLAPFVHPYCQFKVGSEPDLTLQRYSIEVPAQVDPYGTSRVETSLPFAESNVWLLATFAAYCACLSTEPEFDLGLQTETQRQLIPQLFVQSVAIRVQTHENESFSHFYDRFKTGLSRTTKLGSYGRDVVARYPELRHESNPLPVAIVLAATPSHLEFSSLSATLALVVYQDGHVPELVHRGALNSTYSQAIVQQIQCVMTACLQAAQPLRSLPLLSVAERQRILFEWNQTAKPYPDDRCIHELITAQAAKTPRRLAACFGDTQLSYGELDQRSNQLARWLVKLGIEPHDRVSLCLPRSVDLIVGLLGILKAGGAYVPIDPTYPLDRITDLIEDSCPTAIVTTRLLQSSQLSQLEFCKLGNIVCLDDLETLSQFSAQPVITPVTSKHLAYVIYTSGSTGRPKGVEIEHRSVVNHSWAMANALELAPDDRVLQSASISFDVAGEQIYPALFRGAQIIIRPDDLLESFDRFTAFVTSQKITVLLLPTAFWQEWVTELTRLDQQVPPSLKTLSVGTEKVLATCLNQWQKISQNRVTFFQGYGPTETTITCTVYKHDGRLFEVHEVPPIGYPLPNTEAYILNQYLEPVPIGVVGELYIGGDGLARGYHHRPDLTSQCFLVHPFRDRGNRLYKTGDLARFEPDGQIVYCDRGDHQIKLHGFRIELGEIEAVLNQCPGVKQAVVCLSETASTRSLVAYIVCQTGQVVTIEELQTLLKQKLPRYMLPAAMVLTNALPQTLNGKIDRQALAKQTVELKKTEVAPRDELEHQLIQIWQAVLGIQSISVTDSFFELGGNSLAAVRLADRLEVAFNQNLPLAVIFQAPTIQQLAAVLRQQKQVLPSSLVLLQPEGNQLPLFLFQGIDLYRPLASHLAPDRPVYGLALEILSDQEVDFRSIEALATYYLEEIRIVQPTGPYFLGGVSFGGMIAFEVAQQLRANHQEVKLLALLDTPAPGAYRLKPLPKRAIGHLNNVMRFGSFYLFKKLAAKLQRIYYKVSKPTNRPPSQTPSHTHQYQFVREVYEEVGKKYRPQVYPGKITLFLAMARSAMDDSVCDAALVDIDPQFGWGGLAEGGIDIYEVPGDHLGILEEPQVRRLAEVLKKLFKQSGTIED